MMKRAQPPDRLQMSLLDWGPVERKLALRRVSCIDPLEKLVLVILEGHIDPETGHWSMSVAQLAAECRLSESSCRRILNRLDTDPRCTFIRWERQRGRTPQFSIIWENIRDAILASGAAGSSANRDRTRRRRSVSADRTLAESSATGDTKFRQIRGGSSVIAVTEPLYKDLTDLTDNNRPPTDREPDAVVVAVVDAGVVRAAEAVATARSHRMDDQAILDHVRHFRDNPGRWGAAALAKRLQSPSTPYLAPDQGWPPDSPGWRPAASQAATDVETKIRNLTIWQIRGRIPELNDLIDELLASGEFDRKGVQDDPTIHEALLLSFAGENPATPASLANTSSPEAMDD